MFKNKEKIKSISKARRQLRTRAKVYGTAKIPRLNVAKSLNHIYLQLIDDDKGKTLVSFHSKSLQGKGNKTEIAKLSGKELALKAKDNKITTCVFDRASSVYHGRVKAVAEGAREGGLKF